MITVAMPRTRTHLGVAYRDRLAGGSSDNQERAIRAFEDCLSVWTRQRRLEQWAGRLWRGRLAIPRGRADLCNHGAA